MEYDRLPDDARRGAKDRRAGPGMDLSRAGVFGVAAASPTSSSGAAAFARIVIVEGARRSRHQVSPVARSWGRARVCATSLILSTAASFATVSLLAGYLA